MKLQIQDFIPDVRKMLDVAIRDGYDGAELARYVRDGLVRLHDVNHESRYVNGRLVSVSFPADDAELPTFVVDIEERWRLGVVYFAVARCHEVGITDSVNLQLAQTLKQQADAEFRRAR